MPWIYLVLAGALEIAWAIGLKYSEGFSRPWPVAWTLITMVASFWLLAMALKSLPIGTAYAIWTGIGAVGLAILGIILFSESAAWPRLFCIGLIVVGIVGLKVTAGDGPSGITADRQGTSSPS